jgi:hypothetical protein
LVDRAHVHAKRRRYSLCDGELANARRGGGIPKDRRSCHGRRDLLQQF